MSSDENDNNKPPEKKPLSKQVVITHYGKKKKNADIPSEIIPTEPTHIISSPVDIGSEAKISPGTVRTSDTSAQAQPKPADQPHAPQAQFWPSRKADEPGTIATQSLSSAKTDRPLETQSSVPGKVDQPIETQSSSTSKVDQPHALEAQSWSSFKAEQPPAVEAQVKVGVQSTPLHYAPAASQTSNPTSASDLPPNNTDNYNKPPSGAGGGGTLFFNFLFLIAIMIVGYYAYLHDQQLTLLQNKTNDDQTSVLALTQQAHKTLEEFAALHEKNLTEQTALESLKKQLESEQYRLSSLSHNTDWVLAQANYLVFMANQRLKMAQDITTAVAQLNAADAQLISLANPAFLWVREVLAKDIAKLKAFPDINRPELWEQLGLFNLQFNDLHFKALNNEILAKETNLSDETMSAWKKGLWRSWEELKSLIRVTHVETNSIPLALSEQEQAQIIRTLQLLCEQARWAILQGENKIYQSSLQTIKSWLLEYFADDKTKQNLLNQIQQLELQNVNISVPDISASVQALSKAMIEISGKKITSSREAQ